MIHNSQKLETAHRSINRRMDKLRLIMNYYNKKKKQITRCWMNLKEMLSERSPTQGEHAIRILSHDIL